MKLLFKQRFFSWLDSYDVYDEYENIVFTVEGQLSLGHCLHILDAAGNHVGTVKEKILTFLPKYELYVNEEYVGEIKKELTFFRPRFEVDCKDWDVEGSIMEWNYQVTDGRGQMVASVQKRLWNLTDTYEIDVVRREDMLYALMVVLAIDAAKCSEGR